MASSKTKERIKKELSNGILPEEVIEGLSIVIPDTKEKKYLLDNFQKKMREVTKLAMGDEYDPKKHNFRFVISDDKQPNAFFIRHSKPKIIGFTKAALKKVKNLDQLVLLLLHEIRHSPIPGNSKHVESYVDTWAMERAQKSGFCPSEAFPLFKIIGMKIKFPESLTNFIDVHPTDSVAIRNAENKMSEIRHNYGDSLVTTTQPIDKEINDFGKNKLLTHKSYLHKKLVASRYASKAPLKKLEFLKKIVFEEMQDWSDAHKKREEDLDNLITNIKLDKKDPYSIWAIDDFYEDLYKRCDDIRKSRNSYDRNSEKYDKYNNYLNNLNEVFYSVSKLSLNNFKSKKFFHSFRVDGIRRNANLFAKGKSYEETLRAAKAVITNLRNYDCFTRGKGNPVADNEMPEFKVFSYNDFDHPKKERKSNKTPKTQPKRKPQLPSIENPVEPSWYKHIKWIPQDGDGYIAKMMSLMRCEEYLPENDVAIIRRGIRNYSSYYYINNNSPGKDGVSRLIFNDDGKVVGFKNLPRYAFSPDAEQYYFSTRIYLENKALGELNLNEIKSNSYWHYDLDDFVKKYFEVLLPEITYPPSTREEKFIDEFADITDSHLKTSPNNYKILGFYYGYSKDKKATYDKFDWRTSQYQKKDSHDEENSWSFEKGSLPDLMRVAITNFNSVERQSLFVEGVRPENAFIKFILEDKHKLFGNFEKIYAISHIHHNSFDSKHIKKFRNNAYINLIEEQIYKPLLAQVENKFQALEELSQIYFRTKHFNGGYMYRDWTDRARNIIYTLTKTISEDILKDYSEKNTIHELAALNFISLIQIEPENPFYKNAFSNYLEKTVQNLDKIKTEELIDRYKIVSSSELISSNIEAFKSFEEKVKERISTYTPQDKAKYITDILSKETFECLHNEKKIEHTRIINPYFKEWCVKEIAASIKDSTGIDDMGKSSATKILKTVKSYTKKLDTTTSLNLINEVSNKVLSQKELSFKLKELSEKLLFSSMIGDDYKYIFGDYALSSLHRYKSKRDAFVEFVSEPISPKNIENFAKEIFRKDIYDEHKDKCDYQVEAFYNSFWKHSFEHRVYFMEKVLFPVNEKSESEFKDTFKNILDKVFPKGEKFSKEGREIVEAYLSVCEKSDQRLLLTAMMCAHQSNGQTVNTEEVIGVSLGIILDAMRVTGRKLKQAIHGHPSTPDGIRNGLENGKMEAALPNRSDIFARVQETIFKNYDKQPFYIGEVLGGGAYAYTVEIVDRNCNLDALTLQRPNSLSQARFGYDLMLQAVDKLVVADEKYRPLREMISKAKEMAELEAIYTHAPTQTKHAKDQYDGLTINVDGHEYKFYSANLKKSDEHDKISQFAPGHHFNNKETQLRKDIKPLAKAIYTAELYNFLKGSFHDNDRHGGNNKIHGNLIGMIDPGSMSLAEPTEGERKLLGQILAKTMNDLGANQDNFAPILTKNIIDTLNDKSSDENSKYLGSFYRLLLSLEDYRKHIDNKEILNIFSSIIKKGEIHTDIATSFIEKIEISSLPLTDNKDSGASIGIEYKAPKYPPRQRKELPKTITSQLESFDKLYRVREN